MNISSQVALLQARIDNLTGALGKCTNDQHRRDISAQLDAYRYDLSKIETAHHAEMEEQDKQR